jgi:hypothetical protein
MRSAFLLLLFISIAHPAWAEPPSCPIPDGLGLQDVELPLARQAAAAKHLTILVVGGAASAGTAAGGAQYTYAARLQARLAALLPSVTVASATRAVPRRTAAFTADHIAADIAETHANLVIWGVGDVEAGNGVDVNDLADTLASGVESIHTAGADVILMDLQYAPSVARIVDLAPYRQIVLRVGQDEGVPVLDRYQLMRDWSDDGVLDFETTAPKARLEVARQLFDCIAAALADGIAPALQ